MDECEQHCYNTIGNYYCNCTVPGYRLRSDGNSCESELLMLIVKLLLSRPCVYMYFVDVNECAEGIDDCVQICTDTDGSYVCSCAPGYLLTNNSRGCDGMFTETSNTCMHSYVVIML